MKKTPFHVCTAQAIHETCKSKTLITSLNHIGLCISYESLQRMNYSFAARAVSLSENNRVPLSPHFARDIPLCASMENFDHEEDTKSGIGGTHDTELVLFQEDKQPRNTQQNLNIRSNFVGQRQKKLNDLISCQKLVPFVKPKRRGTISSEFEPVISQTHQKYVQRQLILTAYGHWQDFQHRMTLKKILSLKL